MEPVFHEIDLNGDTLFILRKPDEPFAVDDSFQIWPTALPQYWTHEKRQSELELQNSVLVKSPILNRKPDVKMRLSSKHLTMASTYFRKMLANNWTETISKDGYSYTITAEEWDTQSLLILMNIIHGHTQKVPPKVNLEMFAKIAVLVDYYECQKAIRFFAKTWTSYLPRSLPSSYGRDLLLRLLISIVFGEVDTFGILTETIIYESRDQIHSLGLPIPETVVDALDEKREELISDIVSSLHNLKTQFYNDNAGCSFDCCSLSLGALMKGMNAMKLLDPPPEPPFQGYSLITLEKAIRDIRVPNYDQAPQHYASTGFTGFGNSSFGSYPDPNRRNCSLFKKITPIIDNQLEKLGGLCLEEFITLD